MGRAIISVNPIVYRILVILYETAVIYVTQQLEIGLASSNRWLVQHATLYSNYDRSNGNRIGKKLTSHPTLIY